MQYNTNMTPTKFEKTSNQTHLNFDNMFSTFTIFKQITTTTIHKTNFNECNDCKNINTLAGFFLQIQLSIN